MNNIGIIILFHKINLFNNITSLNKFNDGGAEKFDVDNKNHHKVILGIVINIPLLIINLRECVRS